MKSKLINDNGQKTYVLIYETGNEVLTELKKFAEENNLNDSHFTAIGAFRKVILGYFDLDKKDYLKNEVNEQVEVVSLTGNISRFNGKPKIHIHVVVGKKDGNALGGHLLKAEVRPTLEVVLTESPSFLKREFVEEFNLPLIKV
jgi:predicted DNA-binding protein with PD1-like motif